MDNPEAVDNSCQAGKMRSLHKGNVEKVDNKNFTKRKPAAWSLNPVRRLDLSNFPFYSTVNPEINGEDLNDLITRSSYRDRRVSRVEF
jgi:hypothetical protein